MTKIVWYFYQYFIQTPNVFRFPTVFLTAYCHIFFIEQNAHCIKYAGIRVYRIKDSVPTHENTGLKRTALWHILHSDDNV